MYRKTIVIGHGPSLQKQTIGDYIDRFKYVIRFPYLGNWQVPEKYGTRTSYICSTTRRLGRLQRVLPERGYFIWEKRKGRKINSICRFMIDRFGGDDITYLVQFWQSFIPEGRYPYFSHGAAAVIVAAAKLKLPVVIAGCDSLAGCSEYVGSYKYESKYRAPQAVKHDFLVESEIIRKASIVYGVGVRFI